MLENRGGGPDCRGISTEGRGKECGVSKVGEEAWYCSANNADG